MLLIDLISDYLAYCDVELGFPFIKRYQYSEAAKGSWPRTIRSKMIPLRTFASWLTENGLTDMTSVNRRHYASGASPNCLSPRDPASVGVTSRTGLTFSL